MPQVAGLGQGEYAQVASGDYLQLVEALLETAGRAATL